ncbi:hypothetical protein ANAPRD1_01298 [Anaplasma phagocytophilum]|nr:hypothetical protein ANAPRD1_01298 [Anaplasma phagocytophilum]
MAFLRDVRRRALRPCLLGGVVQRPCQARALVQSSTVQGSMLALVASAASGPKLKRSIERESGESNAQLLERGKDESCACVVT